MRHGDHARDQNLLVGSYHVIQMITLSKFLPPKPICHLQGQVAATLVLPNYYIVKHTYIHTYIYIYIYIVVLC